MKGSLGKLRGTFLVSCKEKCMKCTHQGVNQIRENMLRI